MPRWPPSARSCRGPCSPPSARSSRRTPRRALRGSPPVPTRQGRRGRCSWRLRGGPATAPAATSTRRRTRSQRRPAFSAPTVPPRCGASRGRSSPTTTQPPTSTTSSPWRTGTASPTEVEAAMTTTSPTGGGQMSGGARDRNTRGTPRRDGRGDPAGPGRAPASGGALRHAPRRLRSEQRGPRGAQRLHRHRGPARGTCLRGGGAPAGWLGLAGLPRPVLGLGPHLPPHRLLRHLGRGARALRLRPLREPLRRRRGGGTPVRLRPPPRLPGHAPGPFPPGLRRVPHVCALDGALTAPWLRSRPMGGDELTTSQVLVHPPNCVVLILDADPDAAECVVVGTDDAPTTLRLTDRAAETMPDGWVVVFEDTLATPSRRLVVTSVLRETYAELADGTGQSRVRILADHPTVPEILVVEVGAAHGRPGGHRPLPPADAAQLHRLLRSLREVHERIDHQP